MLASLLRPSTRHTLRRHASSSATNGVKRTSHAQLSPQKMRALVSLYHQSESFITPDTLSAAIDHAFFETRAIMESSSESREKSYGHLRRELDDRRTQPKLSGSVGDGAPSMYDDLGMYGRQSDWSMQTPERVRKLKAALYGMDPSSSTPLPGYEVLVEEHERVQKMLKEEREQ